MSHIVVVDLRPRSRAIRRPDVPALAASSPSLARARRRRLLRARGAGWPLVGGRRARARRRCRASAASTASARPRPWPGPAAATSGCAPAPRPGLPAPWSAGAGAGRARRLAWRRAPAGGWRRRSPLVATMTATVAGGGVPDRRAPSIVGGDPRPRRLVFRRRDRPGAGRGGVHAARAGDRRYPERLPRPTRPGRARLGLRWAGVVPAREARSRSSIATTSPRW